MVGGEFLFWWRNAGCVILGNFSHARLLCFYWSNDLRGGHALGYRTLPP